MVEGIILIQWREMLQLLQAESVKCCEGEKGITWVENKRRNHERILVWH